MYTYSNGFAQAPITMAPDVAVALRRHPDVGVLATARGPFDGLRLWCDPTLPAGHHREGVPLAERLREATIRYVAGPPPLTTTR